MSSRPPQAEEVHHEAFREHLAIEQRIRHMQLNIEGHTRVLGWIIVLLLIAGTMQGGSVWPGSLFPSLNLDVGDAHHHMLRRFGGEQAHALIAEQQKKLQFRDEASSQGSQEFGLAYDVPSHHEHHPHRMIEYLQKHDHSQVMGKILTATLLLFPLWLLQWVYLLLRVTTKTLLFVDIVFLCCLFLNLYTIWLRLVLMVQYEFGYWMCFGMALNLVSVLFDIRSLVSLQSLRGVLSLAAFSLERLQEENEHRNTMIYGRSKGETKLDTEVVANWLLSKFACIPRWGRKWNERSGAAVADEKYD